MKDDIASSNEVGFWEGRYQSGRTPWDLGRPAPALLHWLENRPHATGDAIVMGGGRGYDAIALAQAGYAVTSIDICPTAVQDAQRLASERGAPVRFVVADLFELGPEFDASADLVFEHTFLCALPVDLRPNYRKVVASLLRPGGTLLGNFLTVEDPDGPPFAISETELVELLAPDFELEVRAALTPELRGGMGSDLLAVFRRR